MLYSPDCPHVLRGALAGQPLLFRTKELSRVKETCRMQEEIKAARQMLKTAIETEDADPKQALALVRQAVNQLLPLLGLKALAPDVPVERPRGS
jgi:hypothetical protein